MNYVELVNEIFQVCIVPLLGILTTYLVKYITIKMEEIQVKTENEKINSVEKSISEKRKITQQDLDNWFNPNSSYAKFLSENLSKEEFDEFYALIQQSSTEAIFDWQSMVGFVKIG